MRQGTCVVFIEPQRGGATLSKADLSRAILVETSLVDTILTDCRIYGISAWNVKLSAGTKQHDLIVTTWGEPKVATDDLEVAQFIYLLLHEKLQRVIDTITSKVVLILGRFSIPERKAVLNGLRDDLRKRNYVPVVFDFEKPTSRTTDETVTLLARMARFVIADISDARSVLQELRGIVPRLSDAPRAAGHQRGAGGAGYVRLLQARYPWFLNVHRYATPVQLLADLADKVIGPLEAEVASFRAPLG